MFLGCSPCCGVCPDYRVNPAARADANAFSSAEEIANFFLDLSVRVTITAFTDINGNNIPAADTGTVSASGWMYPFGYNNAALVNVGLPALKDIVLYSGVPISGGTYSDTLNLYFRDNYLAATETIGLHVSASLGSGYSSNSFVPRFGLEFAPCRAFNPSDAPNGIASEYGYFDVVALDLSQGNSNSNFASWGDTTLTIDAGNVLLQSPILPLNNWISNISGVHRFTGPARRSQKVMDGVTPLRATWLWEDLVTYGGTTATTFLDLTVNQYTARYGDGRDVDVLPFWADSLATYQP